MSFAVEPGVVACALLAGLLLAVGLGRREVAGGRLSVRAVSRLAATLTAIVSLLLLVIEPRWVREEAVEAVVAAPLADGLRELTWSREVELGDPIAVGGGAVLAAPGRARLLGPGGEEDAVELAAGTSSFMLRTTTRAVGPELHRLQLGDSLDRPIEEIVVDVQVVRPRPLVVLWVETAPSFETRHFKQWLTSGPSTLLLRTAVSRDRVRIETHPKGATFAGAGGASADSGAGFAALDPFDVIVADDAILAGLGDRERADLAAAIEGGLGLLLRPTAARAEPSPLAEGLRVAAVDGPDGLAGLDETMLYEPRWPGSGAVPPLDGAAREIVAAGDVRPIIRAVSGRLIAGARQRGAGRVARTVLADSYRWVLEGSRAAHAGYWRALLRGVARRRSRPTIDVAAGPVYVDRPLRIVYSPAGADASLRLEAPDAEPALVALAQDPFAAGRWAATVYPRRVGWHRLNGGEAWFYAAATPPAHGVAFAGDATTRRGPGERGLPRALLFTALVVALFGLWLDERQGSLTTYR
jgi:hypothetical protein